MAADASAAAAAGVPAAASSAPVGSTAGASAAAGPARRRSSIHRCHWPDRYRKRNQSAWDTHCCLFGGNTHSRISFALP